MIRLINSLAVAAALLLGSIALADDAAKPDDQLVADYLSQYVYELTKPMYVYHWFSAEGRNGVWKTAQSYRSYSGYAHLDSMSVHYWASLCSKNAALNPPDCPPVGSEQFGQSNMYGPGLYAALDPVATIDYGGGSNGQSWVLLKIRMPVGFRFINLKRDGNNAMPLRVQKILSAYQCPTRWIDVRSGLDMMMKANTTYAYNTSWSGSADITLTDTCILELRHLLKDHLKIHGLLYSYSSTSFAECGGYSSNQADLSGTAWVIADSSPFSEDDVQVFTANTPDGDNERVRIMSLFYSAQRSSEMSYNSQPPGDYQSRTYPQFPNYTVYRVSSGCDIDAISNIRKCGVVLTLQSPQNSNYVTVVEPYPALTGKMSDLRLPNAFMNYNKGQALWPDLLNRDLDPNLTTWMKSNLFSCIETLPVRVAPKAD